VTAEHEQRKAGAVRGVPHAGQLPLADVGVLDPGQAGLAVATTRRLALDDLRPVLSHAGSMK